MNLPTMLWTMQDCYPAVMFNCTGFAFLRPQKVPQHRLKYNTRPSPKYSLYLREYWVYGCPFEWAALAWVTVFNVTQRNDCSGYLLAAETMETWINTAKVNTAAHVSFADDPLLIYFIQIFERCSQIIDNLITIKMNILINSYVCLCADHTVTLVFTYYTFFKYKWEIYKSVLDVKCIKGKIQIVECFRVQCIKCHSHEITV